MKYYKGFLPISHVESINKRNKVGLNNATIIIFLGAVICFPSTIINITKGNDYKEVKINIDEKGKVNSSLKELDEIKDYYEKDINGVFNNKENIIVINKNNKDFIEIINKNNKRIKKIEYLKDEECRIEIEKDK